MTDGRKDGLKNSVRIDSILLSSTVKSRNQIQLFGSLGLIWLGKEWRRELGAAIFHSYAQQILGGANFITAGRLVSIESLGFIYITYHLLSEIMNELIGSIHKYVVERAEELVS